MRNWWVTLVVVVGFTHWVIAQNSEKYLVDVSSLSQYGIDTMAYIPRGLELGETAPNFIGIDQDGNEIELYKELEKNVVIVVFYRGHWCGYCSEHLKHFQESLEEFEAMGAKIVAITPETDHGVDGMIKKTGVSFPVISDQSSEIEHLYDVAFHVSEAYQNKIKKFTKKSIEELNKQEVPELPVPATFVIDRDRTVIYSHFDPDFSHRPSMDDIFNAMKL